MAESENRRDRAAAQRKAVILEAAMMCFIDNGYHQTGVRDIAKRAGVSLGNLYNHFAGKHDVLVEIAALERAELDGFLEMLDAPRTPAMALEKFVAAYAIYLAKPENVMLAIEISSEAIRKPDIGELFMANRAELAAALSRVIARGIAEGDFRDSADPDESARLIIDLIDASAYRFALTQIPAEQMLEGLQGFVMAAVRR